MRGRQPEQPDGAAEFTQPSWNVGAVFNTQGVYLPGSGRSPGDAGPPQEAVPVPPDGPEFRRELATLLLRKLTSTLDESHWLGSELIDLTAIVEDVDGHPTTGRRGLRRRRGRQATRPLTQVLAHPPTDLVLLQGGAGAGKSVALRQYALRRLKEIEDGKDPDGPLPVYVNLRELRANPHEINTVLLRQYIADQTGPRGSTAIAGYFAHRFTADLRERRVTLLLDSFDEIPAVLGSATVDAAVSPYVQSVIELVGGGGRCVVASREYKGVRASGWTRLQILGLSPAQQETFLRQLHLDRQGLRLVQPLLTDPRLGFAVELQNPLSLRLLATYVRGRRTVPDRPSALFEEYATQRLHVALDATDTDPDEREPVLRRRVEAFLARFAFLLTATGKGLSVDQASYREEIAREAGGDRAFRAVLTHVPAESRILFSSPGESGLGASGLRESGPGASGDHGRRRVFFGHRRVQQYFASRYVADHPSAVPLHELATDGRWRETAVTVLQDCPPDVTAPLLQELAAVLTAESARDDGQEPFAWSPLAVHCLELLVTAYHGRLEWPREGIQSRIEAMVDVAWRRGSVSDRKFAIDCLPLLPEQARERYIDRAFSSGSNWLRATALRECAGLPTLSPDIRGSIRRLLITMLGEKSLEPESRALDVDLGRLRAEADLLRVRRVISRSPKGIAALCALHVLIRTVTTPTQHMWSLLAFTLASVLVPFACFSWFLASRPLSYGAGKSRILRILEAMPRRALSLDTGAMETETVLSTLLGLAAWYGATQLFIGIMDIIGGHAIRGAVEIVVLVPVGAYSVLWGPSLLYCVRHGRSSRELRGARPVLAVSHALGIETHPLRVLFGWSWWKSAAREAPGFLLICAVIGGFWWGVLFVLGRWDLARLILFGSASVVWPAVILFRITGDLLHELRSLRRVQRAVRQGSRDGSAFFAHLLALHEAAEAAEYVRLIRSNPRLPLLASDRGTLRFYIDSLQGRPAPTAPDRLTKWRGDNALLDELGRLDEQLRPR